MTILHFSTYPHQNCMSVFLRFLQANLSTSAPDAYQNFRWAHFLFDILNALKFSVFHREGTAASRDIIEKILQDHFPIHCKANFRVELRSIQLLRFICYTFIGAKKQAKQNNWMWNVHTAKWTPAPKALSFVFRTARSFQKVKIKKASWNIAEFHQEVIHHKVQFIYFLEIMSNTSEFAADLCSLSISKPPKKLRKSDLICHPCFPLTLLVTRALFLSAAKKLPF